MQSTDNLIVSVAFPGSNVCLCKLLLNFSPFHWYWQTPTHSGKAYALLKCHSTMWEPTSPRTADWVWSEYHFSSRSQAVRPLNEQDPLGCSLPHQDYEGEIRGEARRRHKGQKRQDIVEERGNPQKDGETSTRKSRRSKKHKKNPTAWLSIQLQ